MPSFSSLLQNQHLWDWLIFVVTLVGAVILAPVLIWVVRTVGARIAARSKSTLDDRLLVSALRPLRFVVYTVALLYAIQMLHDRIDPLSQAKTFTTLVKVVQSLVILTVTNLIAAVTKTALDWYLHDLANQSANRRLDHELLPLMRRVASLVFYFIAASIILANFGVNITALVTTAGVASLAVALAAQETLSNMLGGFVILVDRPFRMGDVIQLANGTAGEVIEIGLRSTRIKLFDGNALVVPNKEMASQSITNLALPTPQAAIRVTIGVDYSTDIERAKAVLLATLKAHPEVL
ncbi:MAG TPA: mechanosensitive ion channel domain-containing protein, partial [Symbiobacteriaceae bacterium]|nr:mechanosensitive ion channel domain-containing protein [Symbiobacteriaceae bacterium]